ncbi:sensor histidine kinase [Actinoplanes sp. NPDC049265]|uniref:sensor histidine kinase n=1 Tax=Actinoplanes sp. NPDC049265 TaxID=3363902 RepID=UPI003710DF32
MTTPTWARDRLTRQSLLIAGVCVVTDVLLFLLQDVPGEHPAWPVVLLAIVVSDAALATPTRWSGLVATAAVAVSVGGAVLLGGVPLDLNEAGLLVATYRAGAWLRGAQAVATLGVVVGGLLVAHLVRGFPMDAAVLVEGGKFGLVSWLVGRYTTARRKHLDELRRQAELEERDAREAVERAVAEDRVAIARDLHDVITHHVSAISVHAGAARLRLSRTDTDEPALASLRSVEDASRSALGDLRNMLDLLHGRTATDEEQPRLAKISDLLAGVRAAGIEVRLDVSGPPRALPDSLDTALYRIVQEMLTNALRHGDGHAIDVTVRYGAGVVELETVNGYAPADHPGTAGRAGRGLTGIRNRAGLFGGRVDSGPCPDGRTWSTAVSVDLEPSR